MKWTIGNMYQNILLDATYHAIKIGVVEHLQCWLNDHVIPYLKREQVEMYLKYMQLDWRVSSPKDREFPPLTVRESKSKCKDSFSEHLSWMMSLKSYRNKGRCIMRALNFRFDKDPRWSCKIWVWIMGQIQPIR